VLTLRPEPSPDTPIRGVRNPQRLRAVAAAELHGHLDDPDLDAVVATLRLACGVPMAVINIVTENLQTYPAEVGVGAPCTQVPDGLSFCAEVVDSGLALAVADAAAHPVYSRNPMVLDGVIGAYAGVPLVDDGVVLGSVSIFGGSARKFSAEVLDIRGLQTRLASSVLALRRSARTDVLTGCPTETFFWTACGCPSLGWTDMRDWPASCTATWTAARASTTSSVTQSGMPCSTSSLCDYAGRCVRPTPWRALAATSSSLSATT